MPKTPAALPMLALLCAVTTATACANATTETPEAAMSPSSLTCAGAGTDDNAQIEYRSEILIDAPLSTIWNLQTNVDQWPTWQQPVTTMERLDPGALRAGSQFRWTTPAPATATTPATTLTITSTVHELQDDSCIRWSGPAVGDGLTIDNGVHVWTFDEVEGGVLVRTEETWSGDQVEHDVPTSTTFLGAGLEAWLQDLKTTAEQSKG